MGISDMSRIDDLETLLGELYQVLGYLGAREEVLDRVYAASVGAAFLIEPSLLPYAEPASDKYNTPLTRRLIDNIGWYGDDADVDWRAAVNEIHGLYQKLEEYSIMFGTKGIASEESVEEPPTYADEGQLPTEFEEPAPTEDRPEYMPDYYEAWSVTTSHDGSLDMSTRNMSAFATEAQAEEFVEVVKKIYKDRVITRIVPRYLGQPQ